MQGLQLAASAPAAALLPQSTGGWAAVSMTPIAANFLTVFLAIAVLEPLRTRYGVRQPAARALFFWASRSSPTGSACNNRRATHRHSRSQNFAHRRMGGMRIFAG